MGYDVRFVAKDISPEKLHSPEVLSALDPLLDDTVMRITDFLEGLNDGKETEVIIHLVPDPEPKKLRLLK